MSTSNWNRYNVCWRIYSVKCMFWHKLVISKCHPFCLNGLTFKGNIFSLTKLLTIFCAVFMSLLVSHGCIWKCTNWKMKISSVFSADLPASWCLNQWALCRVWVGISGSFVQYLTLAARLVPTLSSFNSARKLPASWIMQLWQIFSITDHRILRTHEKWSSLEGNFFKWEWFTFVEMTDMKVSDLFECVCKSVPLLCVSLQ